MTKMKALVQNELIKSVKRSVIVLFIIMLSLTLLFGILVELLFSVFVDGLSQNANYFGNIVEATENAEAKFKNSKDAESKLEAAYDLAYYEAQRYLLKDNDYVVEAYKYSMYQEALDMYAAYKFQDYYDKIISEGISIPESLVERYSYMLSVDVTLATVYVKEYKSINSFDDYISYMEKQIDSAKISKAKREIERNALEYHKMIDPKGTDIYSSQSIERYRLLAYSLEDGSDYLEGNSVLAYDKEEQYEKELKALETSFKAGADIDSDRFYGEMTSVIMMEISMAFVSVILIVLAGGMISSEISSGSIKSVIIAPVKRYKIALAKIITVAIYGLGLTLISYFVTLLLVAITNGGFSGVMPHVTSFSLVLPGPVYLLVRFLIYYFEAMVYAMFALMLSTVTKSSSISIAVPLLVSLLFDGFVNFFVSLFGENFIVSTVINCLPTSHFNIANRLFGFSASGVTISLGSETLSLSAAGSSSAYVSLAYLFVLGVGMAFVAIDAFRNRDIVK